LGFSVKTKTKLPEGEFAVQKVIIPLVLAVVILAAVQAQASLVTYALVVVDASHYQVWANDSAGDNSGIAAMSFYVNGAVTAQIRTPSINVDDTVGSADNLGLSGGTGTTATIGNAINVVLGASNTVHYNSDEFIMGEGQNAGNLVAYVGNLTDSNLTNNGGVYNINSTANRMAGDTGVSAKGVDGLAAGASFSSAGNLVTNPFSAANVGVGGFAGVGMELVSGTYTGTISLSNLGASVYTSVPTGLTNSGLTAPATTIHSFTVSAVPEPASLAMLGMGGLLLVSRRRARA
jgi:hypothetical protein